MEIFAFCVITFEPIISKTCHAPQNDRQNISFVKDEHAHGKKMAKKDLKKVIYEGKFISKQSLVLLERYILQTANKQISKLSVSH